MYRSSSFRSTLNTSYIRGLGMCKVCTEAVVFHSSTLLCFYSSILLLFRSVALLCCCSSIFLAGRNLASSSFSIDRLTSADLGWRRLTSADVGWPRLTSADLDRRKFAHTTSWHNGFLEVFLVFGFWLGYSLQTFVFFFSFFCFFWFSPGFCGFWFLTEYAKCWLTRRLIGSDRNPVCLTPWDHYGPNTLKSEEYGNCTGAQAPFQFEKY